MSRPLDGLPADDAVVTTRLPDSRETGASPHSDPLPRSGEKGSSSAAVVGSASTRKTEPADRDGTTTTPNQGSGQRVDEATTTQAATLTAEGTAGAVAATPPATAQPITFPTQPIPKTATVATSQPLPDAPGGAGAIGGAVFALLLVVGLILALAWLAKRMPGVAGSSNAAMRVVGSLSIGPRERVVVVAVGDTQLLLSVGPGGTRTLHTLDAPLAVADAAPSPFAQMLAQHFGKKA